MCSICRPNTTHFSFLSVFSLKEGRNFKHKKKKSAKLIFLFSFSSSFLLLLPADRVVDDDLPGLNKLLLQHLVCILHHILENADTNKMDAYNLAVCIAPTLLQLDVTLDEQKEKMKKVERGVLHIHCLTFGALKLCGFTVQKTSRGFQKFTLAQTFVSCLFS